MKPLLNLALYLTLLSVLGAQDASNPNVVFILADDFGYGDAQCLNPERGKIATPAIDKLAEQGMTFTDAHSTSSVCTPTRYAILTGRYNWRTHLQKSVLYGFAVHRARQEFHLWRVRFREYLARVHCS